MTDEEILQWIADHGGVALADLKSQGWYIKIPHYPKRFGGTLAKAYERVRRMTDDSPQTA